MHLKSVTLKGFKSFAQPTTFVLEPGVTAIVGPNGSGKSNIVDALAWVMGEQGAKTLRGGKMEDVIFAGTSTRGPLGRAEVRLTIDNADGALPIEYAEVTISRTLFRNGASEYAINGQSCRLLDVQELLSDSGLGREMHVIVGQGRLDTVLQATPEERRGFIEEAAGILKHRRRKEKTVRKLQAMEANLTRLNDLAGELRRQLKPLGRQAEIAREAATIAAVVRDAKARLFADELVALRAELAAAAASEQERHSERLILQDRAEMLRARIDELEADQRSEAVDRARGVVFALEQVQERLRGLYTLAGQRLSLLAEDDESLAPQQTVTQSSIDEVRAGIDEISSGLDAAQDAAAEAARDVVRARGELDALDADIAAQSALVSEHDMKITTLRGTAEAAASALAAVEKAVARQQTALDAARTRRAQTQQELDAIDPEEVSDAASAEHASAYERTQREATDAEASVGELRDKLHAAERERESLSAQTKALSRALDIGGGASEIIARGDAGVRGLVSDAVQVSGGWEAAIAAVLGPIAEGVLVDDAETATAVADSIRDSDVGVVDLTIADATAPGPIPDAPTGLTAAVDVVRAPDGVRGLLAGVYLADDLAAAQQAVAAATGTITVATRSGELVTPFRVRAGSGQGRSRLELLAERDAAAERLAEVSVVVDSLQEALRAAQSAQEDARRRAKAALQALRQHDADLAAHAEKANRATVRHEAAVAECERLEATLRQAESSVEEAQDSARSAQQQLDAALEAPRPILDASARDGMLAELEQTRDAEMKARLEVETLKERIRAEEVRASGLEHQRERERAAAEEAARRAVIRRAQRDVAAGVADRLPPLLDSVDRSVSAARVELAAAESARTALTAELSQVRTEEASVRERLAGLTENVHGLEMQIHEKKLHATSLLERVQSELGLEEDILVSEYGPDQPIPAEDEDAEPQAFDKKAQAKRLQDAERKLAQLGRVNPLALEEFEALEQRHKFLTEQLADLTQTRKDLVTIIDELDERMQAIFLDAFEDTRQAFTEVFPILFPGGTGSISLTRPDEPLTTGIEVAVRPVGKKIERLSLLSGGERSLAAVALLTAIFKARPSPFYILDEVEAALDDANLGRLLGVFEQLRASSQLIVITHQKRTMEIADALYGVSMRQDGVSAVVGQRVAERTRREAEPAPA